MCVCTYQHRCPQRPEKTDPSGAMELQVVINSQTWGPNSATQQKKYIFGNTACSNTEGS